jgi:DNA-binding transcriptional LysR family regulator
MFRPTQLELVTRKLGESATCCCAHEDYLARRGWPEEIADLYEHDLIGFDRSTLIIDTANAIGVPVTRDDFVVRTDSQTGAWELLKAGVGIGFAQRALVEACPGMAALLPQLILPALEVWLTTHRELFTSRRIRAIYDRLGALLTHHLRHTGAAGTKAA